jgi:hypothetical protein
MKKNLIVLVLIFFTSFSHAEIVTFKAQPIQNSKSPFTGNIPYIQGKGFDQVNHQMKKQLLVNDGTPIDFDSEKLYQDQHYLTIQTHLDIQGGRSYSHEKYFVIDLKSKKILSLNQILKRQKLSADELSKQIAQQISPCLDDRSANKLDLCESTDMQYLFRNYAENNNFIHLKNAASFYLKKNILGISFDAGAYSVPFEFNLKTKQIQ